MLLRLLAVPRSRACVNAITAPVLQGLGAVRIPAVLLLAAALLKGVFNAVLVPLYGIEGAAIAGIAALTAAALLGTAAVRFKAAEAGASLAGSWGVRRSAGEKRRRPLLGNAAAGTGFALAVMAAALAVAERAMGAALGGLPPRAAAAALALTCVAVGACAFGAAALRGGAVSARELRALPGGGVLAARLQRWRLMPPRDERQQEAASVCVCRHFSMSNCAIRQWDFPPFILNKNQLIFA